MWKLIDESGDMHCVEIAATLVISINTVRRHIMAIYEKLPVNSHLEAVGKLGRI